MYFRYISTQIKDRRKKKQIGPVDWQEYAALTMLQLNPPVRQYDGFTPAWRVCGRKPEMPIGTVDSPFYIGFTNPENAPVTQTHHALAKLRGFKKPLRKATLMGNLTGV